MHKHNNNEENHLSHQAEYALIKKDLYKVLLINCIYLAALLVLYFTNKQSQYLEYWFSRILGV
jgi:hypothetical protein